MNQSIEISKIDHEAHRLRKRLKFLMAQMREQGPVPRLLNDYSHCHKRLVHLQEHYGV